MCDPVIGGAIVGGVVGGAGIIGAGGVAAGIAGAGLGLQLGGYLDAGLAAKDSAAAQADAYKKQAEHIKLVAEFNARQIERQAQQVRIQGTQQENEIRAETTRVIAEQQAAFAANSIVISSGTPAALQVSTARQGEVDALRMRDQTIYASEALIEQAAITRLEGDAAAAAAIANAQAAKDYGDNAFLSSILKMIGTGVGAVKTS